MELKNVSLTWGSDPELFFTKDGKVVPSKEVIKASERDGVACDGFQFELHPIDSFCREIAGSRIFHALLRANEMAHVAGCDISYEVGYDIDSDTFKKLSPMERRFGCAPTINLYEGETKKPTGLRVKFRSGGGHVHLGLPNHWRKKPQLAADLVRIMDIVVGNNIVFFDQSPASTLRRKYYGRAGEYRLKPYGLEYRVPSNFWMKGYVLWSMVTGLMRQSCEIYSSMLMPDLLRRFDEKKVREAINSNSPTLALDNLMIYKQFIIENNIESNSGLTVGNIEKFIYWATTKPDKYYPSTPDDSLANWEEKATYGASGFESTLSRIRLPLKK